MKRILVFSLMLILALTMFSSCASRRGAETPEVYEEEEAVEEEVVQQEPETPQQQEPARELTFLPLTPALLQRLGNSIEMLSLNVPRLQVVLSGGVVMETSTFLEHPLELSGIDARIRNEHIRQVITINASTMGEAMNVQLNADEVVFSVGFDDDESLFLNFVNTGKTPDGLFYLRYISIDDYEDESNGRGFIMYGDELFSLSYDGENSPHLLLVLSEYDEERLLSRTLPGRRVR